MNIYVTGPEKTGLISTRKFLTKFQSLKCNISTWQHIIITQISSCMQKILRSSTKLIEIK